MDKNFTTESKGTSRVSFFLLKRRVTVNFCASTLGSNTDFVKQLSFHLGTLLKF